MSSIPHPTEAVPTHLDPQPPDEARAGHGHAAVSATLFLSLFASQAGLIALSPVLAEVARDLDVSTAAAGQLRTISGLAAGTTALALPVAARRLGLRRLLLWATALLAAGALASAASTTFLALALAQVLVGVAVAALVTGATAAAAEWVAPDRRARALSWALIGNPAAWIVGMPLIGLVAAHGWRYAWLAMPVPAAVAALFAVARCPAPPVPPAVAGGAGLPAALADATVRRWAAGELLATSAWTGLLVYSGALFAESYGLSTAVTGIVLAGMAAAFVAGNLTFRRIADRDLRGPLVRLALAMAVVTPLVGIVRTDAIVTVALLSAASFLAGGRTLLGNAFGLQAAPERRVAVMAARAAANQFGYFVGASVGGVALALAGYGGLGVVFGVLLVGAAASLAAGRRYPRAAADAAHAGPSRPARTQPSRPAAAPPLPSPSPPA